MAGKWLASSKIYSGWWWTFAAILARAGDSIASPTALPALAPNPTRVPQPTPSPQPSAEPSQSPLPKDPEFETLKGSLVYLAVLIPGFKDASNDDLLASEGVKSSISESDDTPMEHVALQFPFLYGGQRFRHTWINPNGFVSFAPTPPCGFVFIATGATTNLCSFDTAPYVGARARYAGYQNLVAAFASDFDPSAFNASLVTYASTSSKLLVRWVNLSLYGSDDASFTFSVELRASGAVRVFLEEVKDIDEVPDAPFWVEDEGLLVGLRFFGASLNRTTITKAQQAARSDWLGGMGSSGTGVDGVYLPRASVVARNTRLDFCSVPTHVCVSPGFARLPSVASNGLNVTLTAAAGAWGCDDDLVAFRACFTNASVSAASGRCAVVVVENAAPGRIEVDDSTSVEDAVAWTEIVCPLPESLMHYSPASYVVSFEYASAETMADWQVVPFNTSISLIFTTLAAAGSEPEGNWSACDACGVDGGNSGCLGCNEETAYAEYDCARSCDGESGVFMKDLYETCCEVVNGTDCRGVCGGTWSKGWSNGYYACCSSVDCTGKCSGTAAADSCGACSGGTSGHIVNADIGCDSVCFSGVTCAPTQAPTHLPSPRPSSHKPTQLPTFPPTSFPSLLPSLLPTLQPTFPPTRLPTHGPTRPTLIPSPLPTQTQTPTLTPTSKPSVTTQPSLAPSLTSAPSLPPSSAPSPKPSFRPTPLPTLEPTPHPSSQPTAQPTKLPTLPPTFQPTPVTPFPTSATPGPTPVPTPQPSLPPTPEPSPAPSALPVPLPTPLPSPAPSLTPTTTDTASVAVEMELDAMPDKPTAASVASLKATVYTALCDSSSALVAEGDSCRVFDFHVAYSNATRRHLAAIAEDTASAMVQDQRRLISQSYIWEVSFKVSAPLSSVLAVQGGPGNDSNSERSVFLSAVTSILSEPAFEALASANLGVDSLAVDDASISATLETRSPSSVPTPPPYLEPTQLPTYTRSRLPTSEPSRPTVLPTPEPSAQPIPSPSGAPTPLPFPKPTAMPSMAPTHEPTLRPSPQPTHLRISMPSHPPSKSSTNLPTSRPISYRTPMPTTRVHNGFESVGSNFLAFMFGALIVGACFVMTKGCFTDIDREVGESNDDDNDTANAEIELLMRSRRRREQRAVAAASLAESIPVIPFTLTKVAAKVNEERTLHEKEEGTSSREVEEEVCSICLMEFEAEDGVKELFCGHCYHAECLNVWLRVNPVCPLCKAPAKKPGDGNDDAAEAPPPAERPSPPPLPLEIGQPDEAPFAGPGLELTPRSPPRAQDVALLVSMGFSQRVALHSLQRAGGNLAAAVGLATDAAMPVARAPPSRRPPPPRGRSGARFELSSSPTNASGASATAAAEVAETVASAAPAPASTAASAAPAPAGAARAPSLPRIDFVVDGSVAIRSELSDLVRSRTNSSESARSSLSSSSAASAASAARASSVASTSTARRTGTGGRVGGRRSDTSSGRSHGADRGRGAGRASTPMRTLAARSSSLDSSTARVRSTASPAPRAGSSTSARQSASGRGGRGGGSRGGIRRGFSNSPARTQASAVRRRSASVDEDL